MVSDQMWFEQKVSDIFQINTSFYYDETSEIRLLKPKNATLLMYVINMINPAFSALEPSKIKIMAKSL